MRLLFILLLVISCGKHEMPRAVDTHDDDGDQIPNYREDSLGQYVANIEPIGKVKGVIRFNHNGGTELAFSNHFDQAEDAMKLMVGRETEFSDRNYFSEWTKAQVEEKQDLGKLPLQQYTVHIQFQPMEVNPEELYFIRGESATLLGKWSPYMQIEMSSSDLESLALGEGYLQLHKKFYREKFRTEDSEETIKEKTRRLYYLKNGKASILYVAKNISLSALLPFLNIDAVSSVQEEELFFMSEEGSAPGWFVRDFLNGDQVLAFTTIQDIRSHFLERFHFSKSTVSRINGTPKAMVSFKNRPGVDLYFKLRAIQTVRTFKEGHVKKDYYQGGGGFHGNGVERWSCTHYTRSIVTESPAYPDIYEIFNNLHFQSNGVPFKVNPEQDLRIIEKSDERGKFWEIKFHALQENITLSVIPKAKATFVTTGQYALKCPRGYHPFKNAASYSTNQEGKLSLEIESYVEKID